MKTVIRNFDLTNDLSSIPSFLASRKEAHGHSYFNSPEWFKWKFIDSPNGASLMPTAFEEERIVGANYYGNYFLMQADVFLETVMPYEAFVHEICQGQGVFKKLIRLGEKLALENNVQIMLAFPNKKSLQGFISSGWKYIPNAITYWIKPKLSLRLLVNFLDIKKSFIANKSRGKNNFKFLDAANKLYTDQIHGYWSKEYLNWRFNVLPQAEYIHMELHSFELVARIGFRGKLKETQVLYLDTNNADFNKRQFKQLIKGLEKKTNSDIISFPMSEHFPIYHKMRSLGFYKLPSGTQFTYKVMNENINTEDLKFSLCGLDFHTY